MVGAFRVMRFTLGIHGRGKRADDPIAFWLTYQNPHRRKGHLFNV